MSLLVRRNIELSAEVVVESNNGPMTTWMVTMADASGLLPRRSISGRSKGFLVDGSSPENPRAAGSSNEADRFARAASFPLRFPEYRLQSAVLCFQRLQSFRIRIDGPNDDSCVAPRRAKARSIHAGLRARSAAKTPQSSQSAVGPVATAAQSYDASIVSWHFGHGRKASRWVWANIDETNGAPTCPYAGYGLLMMSGVTDAFAKCACADCIAPSSPVSYRP
jgi:hypothetical protein